MTVVHKAIFSYCFRVFAGGASKETMMDGKLQTKKERSGAEPIIVPIVLKMAEFDHEVFFVSSDMSNSESFFSSYLLPPLLLFTVDFG